MIRVLLVDDHRLVRAGLRALLATVDDIEVVGVAADGAEALLVASGTSPDVVLMDLSMPGMGGVDATRELRRLMPAVRVVVLTSFPDEELVLRAVDAGAVGYLLKDAEPEDLVQGIRDAAEGGSPVSGKVAWALLRREPAASELLSAREREVLSLVAEGLTNKRIASHLGISEATVKAHLTNIYQRLGIADRTQAALWARRHGLAGGAG
jgi:DNA-binding NarL/FixJ family response regulator